MWNEMMAVERGKERGEDGESDEEPCGKEEGLMSMLPLIQARARGRR